MTQTGGKNWTGALQEIVESLNNTKMETLGNLSPSEARFDENHDKVWHHKYHSLISAKEPTSKIRPGMFVRVSVKKISLGEKNYTQNWGEEIFKVIKSENRTKSGVVVHQLADADGEVLQSWYYDQNLQVVAKPRNLESNSTN